MPLGSPEQTQISPESTKTETKGLTQTRQLITRYQQLIDPTQVPDEVQLDTFLQRFGVEAQTLVRPTDATSSITTDHLVIRTDATNILLGQLIERGRAKFESEPGSSDQRYRLGEEALIYERQTPEQRMETDFAELSDILQIQRYLTQVINSSSSKDAYAPLLERIDDVADIYKSTAIKSLVKNSEQLFTEDALGKDGIPSLKDGLDPNTKTLTSNLLETIKKLLILNKIPTDLVQEYQNLLNPLIENQKVKVNNGYRNTTADKVIKYDFLDLKNYHTLAYTEKFSKNMRFEAWDSLDISPQQVQKLYDITAPNLIRTLFAGGRESWDGTSAVGVLALLRDPRSLPHLLEHLRRFGAGHTTNYVAYAVSKIAKDPIDQDSLKQIIEQATPLQRRIINSWFKESNSVVSTILQGAAGYSLASLVQQAEQYLGRGDLLDIAVKIAQAQGREISKETLVNYFYNNQFVNSSEIEDLLLQDLDTVANIIAVSKIASDWKTASPKVFNALINPQDKDWSKFPRLIASKGLGLTYEETEQIAKLYQSGDLRRGVMARGIFAEGLLFLSSKTEGQQIMRDVLSISPGANRDSERIREIFTLLRSLDSFGRFEFTKRDNLADTASDLKNKLVTVVGEKMELTESESLVLNQRLFELMKTGLFEIVPQLLAKFHTQGRTEVTNVVREIGKHIVLDDFREWRNNLPTALEQLSHLTEERKSAWLNPVPEISMAIGVNRESAQQGAIDAITQIAIEAKAHILEIYKLDFSQTGINVLKAQQSELVQQLKDSTRTLEERRDLGDTKRGIDNQLRVIEGILGLENLTADRLDPIQLNRYISGIINSLSSFPKLDQAAADLTQINEVLTTQKQIGNTATIKSYDSDDPMALLKVGTEPRETCQSYRSGSYNHCLPAYVVDANKRVINAEDDKGEIIGRTIMKLTHIKGDNDQTHPAILLEPIYTTSEIGPIYQAVVRVALAKAKATGAYLIMTGDVEMHTGANNEHSIPIAESEAKKTGMQFSRENVGIYLPKSANPYEYSDSLGGEQSYFGNYHNLSDAIIIKP